MRISVYLFTIALVCLACSKDGEKGGERVEIYLTKSFMTVPGKCQVDPLLSVIADTPFIKNQDILAYSKSSYNLKLADTAVQKIKLLRDFTPFAVAVDGHVIYYGICKPWISSSSCDHSITLNTIFAPGNEFTFNLGYPWSSTNTAIDDQRNNSRLIATFIKQGKLRL
ncbi:MAG: hypothetical protein H7Y03_13390 [Chitinophagaceae bacterium]|nr:hypothetical protein [Chitinophagaceae bacterium]